MRIFFFLFLYVFIRPFANKICTQINSEGAYLIFCFSSTTVCKNTIQPTGSPPLPTRFSRPCLLEAKQHLPQSQLSRKLKILEPNLHISQEPKLVLERGEGRGVAIVLILQVQSMYTLGYLVSPKSTVVEEASALHSTLNHFPLSPILSTPFALAARCQDNFAKPIRIVLYS